MESAQVLKADVPAAIRSQETSLDMSFCSDSRAWQRNVSLDQLVRRVKSVCCVVFSKKLTLLTKKLKSMLVDDF